MESFDTVTLRVFLAIARRGSIGAAARSEHIAASAVSRRISDLERDLNTTLITRTPAGASLTPAGKAFAEHSEQLLNKYADIRSDLKRYADGEAGDLRIAAVPRALDGTLPSVLAAFKEENPAVRITVQECFSRQGIRYLREDLSDLSFVYDSTNLKGFSVMPYKKDPVWVVGHNKHPLFAKYKKGTPINFRETLDYEYLSYHDGGVLDELIADARRREGRSAKHKFKLLRVNSLLKCAEAGFGLGVIGERDLLPNKLTKNLKVLPLADEWAQRNLVCIYPKGQAASPIVGKLLDFITAQDS